MLDTAVALVSDSDTTYLGVIYRHRPPSLYLDYPQVLTRLRRPVALDTAVALVSDSDNDTYSGKFAHVNFNA